MIEIKDLLNIFNELGKQQSIDFFKYLPNTKLGNIEWLDSLGWTLLYNEIEDKIKYPLPLDELLECQTIQDIFLLINSNGSK